jgi:hypothetical protein
MVYYKWYKWYVLFEEAVFGQSRARATQNPQLQGPFSHRGPINNLVKTVVADRSPEGERRLERETAKPFFGEILGPGPKKVFICPLPRGG